MGCNEDHCSTTDSAMPRLEDMTPVVATGGAVIKTTPPEGINGFTLQNLTEPGNDGYTVPTTPGSYLYEIQCTWPQDQGRANFYFAVTVE
ncbi:hypothetical protein ACQKLN_07000 [Paenibacillus glucanolyticus]|uniref:hypothetical protein n=1 Tax=Paenibacillus glucanolyticus TaxID=59843 RepID=UPI00117E65E0|nr:hypothetical protein [Paenibacillus glucanolyticus]